MYSLLLVVAVFTPIGRTQCIQNVPTVADLGPMSPFLGTGPNPPVQAIIPQYVINCTGFVTQWKAAVRMPSTSRPMFFQVWRPSGAATATAYSLVGSYPVSSIDATTKVFSVSVPAPSQLVMPGDVLGYYYTGDWKVQVNTASTRTMAYYVQMPDAVVVATLNTYAITMGAPMISAVIQQVVMSSQQISPIKSSTSVLAVITSTPVPSMMAAQLIITMTTIPQGTPIPTVITTSSPSVPSIMVIVIVVTIVLTLLALVVSIALILICVMQLKRRQSKTNKKEAMNQSYTNAVIKSSLVPLDMKAQDGFYSMPELTLIGSTVPQKNYTHSVDSSKHYKLAENSIKQSPDGIAQPYAIPETIRTTVDEPSIVFGRYEMVELNKYETTAFPEEMYWSPALTASGLYEQLATRKYHEILVSQLRMLHRLGSGQFGQVSLGKWSDNGREMEVAVKKLKDGASEEDKVKFLQEAAIMGQFSHPNVVKMYGVVTTSDPPMIVLELMVEGDLQTFLRRPTLLEKYDQQQLKKMFLRFSQEIAFGMLYLSHKAFIHRDLAARNILLTANLTCKIGDFGMARNLIDEDYYTSKGGVVPVKWTAPEALLYKKYSSASDVYSFGMVMYEIWGLGTKPFQELRNMDVLPMVLSSYCLPPPPGCSRAVYSLMVDCWHPQCDKRLQFSKVVNYLKKPEELLLYWSAEDLASARGGADIGSSLLSTQHLFPDLQNRYKDSGEHC